MWKPISLEAKDFSSFHELNYTFEKGHATLIFGNNMDNESQLSNGSGKSAFLEAIAVGLTGSTLRDIKTDEIINDHADEATVVLQLENDSTGQRMLITRVLSRKKPQNIEVSFLVCNEEGEPAWEPCPEPSVNEYNRLVLEQIGITKEDLYNNYILCKHKYASFLSSSDKEKKEIINRFSNGVLVDESIEELHKDMEPAKEKLLAAQGKVENCKGKIQAVEEQIETSLRESAERSKNKKERIAEWEDKIAEKRAQIRQLKEEIKILNDSYEDLDTLNNNIVAIEELDLPLEEAYGKVKEELEKFGVGKISDYGSQIKISNAQINGFKKEIDECNAYMAEQEKHIKEIEVSVEIGEKYVEDFEKEFAKNTEKINADLNNIQDLRKELSAIREVNMQRRSKTVRNIARLEKQLAGVIVCPKCKHEFLLSEDVDLMESRKEYELTQKELEKIEADFNKLDDASKSYDKSEINLNNKLSEYRLKRRKCTDRLETLKGNLQKEMNAEIRCQGEIDSLNAKISALSESISLARDRMFDEAYAEIDKATSETDTNISNKGMFIGNANGAIASYQESIEDIKKSSENNITESLEESKKRYQTELAEAISEMEKLEGEFNKLKNQESTFVEFKTYLANSKIEALGAITNEFLEAIGSDIRIVFSGYTVLKSGKVRDKISISLERDGVDCGSFCKFSEGEKARVNLANILAMHKLTNVSCDEGKGLDLLILDEILDATDETGLANIFDSLNSFKITSLVVSHGLVQEGYPYKLIVNKKNGVSYLND